tara:strand:- start:833 stop:1174 length:342 start_codon:yes stop_codon:yes gene_type:complete
MYEKLEGASPLTSSPLYANPTIRTSTKEMIPTTLMGPPAIPQIQNTDFAPKIRGSNPKDNIFRDMMQAKTDLIAKAIKLLGPNGNENAQSILKKFSYTELVDVVEDLTPKSAN